MKLGIEEHDQRRTRPESAGRAASPAVTLIPVMHLRGRGPPARTSGSTSTSSAHAARRLEQDRVVGRAAGQQQVQRRRPGRRRRPRRAAGMPAAMAPVGDARAPAPTTISRSARSRRVRAHLAMRRFGALAQLQHLAQDRHVATGQVGQQVQRGGHRVGRRRCSCRPGCATWPVVDERASDGAPGQPREPGGDGRLRRGPRADADGGRGQRVVHASGGPSAGVATSIAHVRQPQPEAHAIRRPATRRPRR